MKNILLRSLIITLAATTAIEPILPSLALAASGPGKHHGSSEASSSPLTDAEQLERSIEAFNEIAPEPGEIDGGRTLAGNAETVRGNQRWVDTEKGALELKAMYDRVVRDYHHKQAELNQLEKDCPNCSGDHGNTALAASQLAEITSHITDQAPACSEEQANRSLSRCMLDIDCNLTFGTAKAAASLVGVSAVASSLGNFILDHTPDSKKAVVKSCVKDYLSGQRSSCVVEAVYGVFKDLDFQIGGIVRWAGHKIAHIFRRNKTLEDKTSDIAQVAGHQGPGFFTMLKKDPIGTMQAIAKGLVRSTISAIQNNYLCEKWSGTPHLPSSTCVQPYQGLACMSCGALSNAVCGVAGVLGGEILTALVTGAAVGAIAGGVRDTVKGGVIVFKGTSKAAWTMTRSAVAKTAEVNAKLAEILPKVGKAEEVAMDAARASGRALKAAPGAIAKLTKLREGVEATGTVLKRIEASEGWAKVMKMYALTKTTAKTVGKKTHSTVKVVLHVASKNTPEALKIAAKGAAKTAKTLTLDPVSWYMRQMDQAFMRGMSAGQLVTRSGRAAAAAAKAAEASKTAIGSSEIDDLVLQARQGPAAKAITADPSEVETADRLDLFVTQKSIPAKDAAQADKIVQERLRSPSTEVTENGDRAVESDLPANCAKRRVRVSYRPGPDISKRIP